MSIADKQVLLKNIESELRNIFTHASVTEAMRIISSEISQFNVDLRNDSEDVLDDFLSAFIDAKRVEGRSEKTIERYRYIITKMQKAIKTPQNKITVYHLRSYLMEEKNRGISDSTLEGNRSVFSAYFGWLYKEKLIDENPCNNLGCIKHIKKIRTPFSDVELERLKEMCTTERDKALISVLHATGCRISEVCGMDISDVDFQQMEATVLGKGNKERTVFLDDVSVMQLKRYLDKRKDNSPALFIGRGTSRMTPGGVRFCLKKLAERAGVENVHPHRFRRTLATGLIDRGMPIQEVASILGHENVNTTMTYVYINKHNVKNAYRKFA